jgi:hypothetical protein
LTIGVDALRVDAVLERHPGVTLPLPWP